MRSFAIVNHLIIILSFLPIIVTAQQATVVYEFAPKHDLKSRSQVLLAASDSNSFTTLLLHAGKAYRPEIPYGSGFQSHNTYIDLRRGLLFWQSESYGQPKYLVADTLMNFSWTLDSVTKSIGTYICTKAIGIFYGKTITVWYTPAIPVPFGPDGLTGLPGLVLEAQMGQGGNHYKAIEVKLSSHPIVEPTQGKRITATEFRQRLNR